MTVRIVTDSTCDLPANIIRDLGISLLPVYIHIGNKQYQDDVDLSREEFYQSIDAYTETPTTAIPSQAKLAEMYNHLGAAGATEILSIHISSALSGLVNMAQSAANEVIAVPVTVFDSRQLSLGTGFLVQKAAEMAREGYPLKAILAALEEQIKRTFVAAGLNTLKYLKKSGRVNPLVSKIGELIQLKPILKMYDGVSRAERVRTQHKVILRLAEMIKEHSPIQKITFLHSGAVNSIQTLIKEVEAYLPDGKIQQELINPVLGVHIGPGAIGFACITKE
jgi:DegV family protein with EDD domain